MRTVRVIDFEGASTASPSTASAGGVEITGGGAALELPESTVVGGNVGTELEAPHLA